jgi:thiamine-monophosphate kinase
VIKSRKRIKIDIGDDSACFRIGREDIIMTTDMVVEGVHFDPTIPPMLIGRKAMARALSDLAAMGCYPRYAIVCFGLEKGRSLKYAKDLYKGLTRLADRFGVRIVGGDFATYEGRNTISVTAVGERKGLKLLRRLGAREGDFILITGKLGGSLLRKHLMFTPRIKEAIYLNRNYRLHSMIDVSDGLILDLWKICSENTLGAVLFREKIPISNDAKRLSKDTGKDRLFHALYDGEDYELLFTTSKGEGKRIESKGHAKIIGEMVKGTGIWIKDLLGELKEVKIEGYEHKLGG